MGDITLCRNPEIHTMHVGWVYHQGMQFSNTSCWGNCQQKGHFQWYPFQSTLQSQFVEKESLRDSNMWERSHAGFQERDQAPLKNADMSLSKLPSTAVWTFVSCATWAGRGNAYSRPISQSWASAFWPRGLFGSDKENCKSAQNWQR